MGKTNYNKMSNYNAKPENENIVIEEVINETEEPEMETPANEVVSEEVIMPTTVKGVVTNCVKLNVRENASTTSKVLCIISEGSEVTVQSETLPNEWFSIITDSGIEGFCMSKYITIEE